MRKIHCLVNLSKALKLLNKILLGVDNNEQKNFTKKITR